MIGIWSYDFKLVFGNVILRSRIEILKFSKSIVWDAKLWFNVLKMWIWIISLYFIKKKSIILNFVVLEKRNYARYEDIIYTIWKDYIKE